MSLHSAVRTASRKTLPLVASVSVAWLLVACGGEKKTAQSAGSVAAASSAPSTPSFDPCSLATVDEVKAVVSWTPTKAEAAGRDGYGTCTYTGRKDPMILPPEEVQVGISTCVTNFPCYEPLPEFRSSQEFVAYRLKRYRDDKMVENMHPNVVALQDFGVPAIEHELAENRSVEMYVGPRRVVFVTTWVAAGPTRELAKKVLARAR